LNYSKSLKKMNYQFFRVFVTFYILLFFAVPCFSQNYYVSSSTGNDGNNGLTAQTAVKTFKKISTFPLLPGDSILLKRGDKWNEKLKLQKSGSPERPITLDAYGTGKKPQITGITTIDPKSWRQVGESGIYYQITGKPYGVFEDGVKIIDDNRYNIPDGNNTKGNPTLTGSGGDWYFDSLTATLYYRPTSGVPGDHLVQYSTYSAGIYINEQSYIEIRNMNISYIGGSAVYVNASNHITVDNCDISYTFEHGIQFRNSRGFNIATNNTITQVGDGIYWTANNKGPNLAANNTISYCNYIKDGSQYNNNDGHAIGMQNGDRFVVRDNTVFYTNMPAILIWVGSGSTGKDCVVKGNTIFAGNKKTYLKSYYGIGIGWHSTDAAALTGTRLYGNIIKGSTGGFKLYSSHSPGAKVFNNTIYNCSEGIRLKKADNWILKNNIVAYTHNYQIYEEDNLVGSRNIFDHNLYYPDISNGWKYRGDTLSNFRSWQITSKQDMNSIIEDPLFSNPASDNFCLSSASPAIDAGVWLTTITSASASGKSFSVDDASYFYDGYGISGEKGDAIKTEAGEEAIITEIIGNKITVDRIINWTSGNGLSLKYYGSSPDIGAQEYQFSSGLTAPKQLRISQPNSSQ
jgi:parallel beta-helix repeat protein